MAEYMIEGWESIAADDKPKKLATNTPVPWHKQTIKKASTGYFFSLTSRLLYSLDTKIKAETKAANLRLTRIESHMASPSIRLAICNNDRVGLGGASRAPIGPSSRSW